LRVNEPAFHFVKRSAQIPIGQFFLATPFVEDFDQT
jgi:hypothetical protein